MSDKRVEIFIPRQSDREDPNLFVGINGVNYLLPRGLAAEATVDNINTLKLKEKAKAAQIAKEKAEAEANAKKLAGVQVIIRAKAGKNGKLFGAVNKVYAAIDDYFS